MLPATSSPTLILLELFQVCPVPRIAIIRPVQLCELLVRINGSDGFDYALLHQITTFPKMERCQYQPIPDLYMILPTLRSDRL
ncbi:hypothetical protein DSO57_1009481 [Entomophthora muscae]|uniref:Uncharacterized protein n=1 Tax=Entomophthora muscae TaxID=34485 RepID=A0ACC2UGJ7_9FUNG|nr:hypothetical protein DSO57_1009481 [Entomophthora muscae]